MNSNIPTPRTDEACGIIHDANAEWAQTFEQQKEGGYVSVDFARTLEIELTEMKVVVENQKSGINKLSSVRSDLKLNDQVLELQSSLNSIPSQLEAVRNKVIEEWNNEVIKWKAIAEDYESKLTLSIKQTDDAIAGWKQALENKGEK